MFNFLKKQKTDFRTEYSKGYSEILNDFDYLMSTEEYQHDFLKKLKSFVSEVSRVNEDLNPKEIWFFTDDTVKRGMNVMLAIFIERYFAYMKNVKILPAFYWDYNSFDSFPDFIRDFPTQHKESFTYENKFQWKVR